MPFTKINGFWEFTWITVSMNQRNTFPGGCILVTFPIELDDTHPHLMKEVNIGFERLKSLPVLRARLPHRARCLNLDRCSSSLGEYSSETIKVVPTPDNQVTNPAHLALAMLWGTTRSDESFKRVGVSWELQHLVGTISARLTETKNKYSIFESVSWKNAANLFPNWLDNWGSIR